MKTVTKKMMNAMVLGASLLLGSNCVKAQTDWDVAGNSATTTSNFLGTIDTMPLKIRTFNAERVHINGNTTGKVGYVGIGTTAPSTRLHVNGVITATGGTSTAWNTAVTRVPAGTTSKVPRWSGTAYVAGSIFDNGTNVGIGTTAPTTRLDVKGLNNWDLSTTQGDFRIGDATNNFKMGVALAGGGTGNVHMSATTLFVIGTGTTQPNLNTLTIGGGQVGIGVLYPTAKLDIAGDAKINGVMVGRGSGGITTNTAVGDGALNVNTTGHNNTAVGNFALDFNLGGSNNSAFGEFSLYSNNNGDNNTSTGYQSLYHNDAANNTANGSQALYANTSGTANTAMGSGSMLNNLDGYQNAAFGTSSLGSNVSGFYNTAVGHACLAASTGNDNTAIGRYTLIATTTGNGNTAIGSGANPAGATGAEFNTTILGFLASTSGGVNNAVQIGNSAVTSVKAANNVVIVSDGRFKKNIQQNVPGLDFINALSPVTYNYDVKGLDKFKGVDVSSATNKTVSEASLKQYAQAVDQKEKIRYSGFVAQDVEKAAEKLGYDFSGVYKPQSEKDPYGLSYAEFVVPIVKAVQELDAKNKKIETENAELKNKNQSLENRLNDMQQCLETLCAANETAKATNAKAENANTLFQNQPNPFNQSTIIAYQLSSEAGNTQIAIRNLNGELVKSIAVNQTGKGQVTINANELAQGTYTYTLIVNNQSADTKLMVVIK